MTACHRNGTATETNGRGVFTEMLLDALNGSASDVCGRITPASVYSHVDQTLGPWEQRPIYKANVQTFITLRQVDPKIPLEVLRRLPTYFPDAAYQFPLDPSYEPDRQNVPPQFRSLPRDPDHERILKELQMCNRHGLVIPVDAEHMYYAAINSTSCRLTALGAHYRQLAEIGRIWAAELALGPGECVRLLSLPRSGGTRRPARHLRAQGLAVVNRSVDPWDPLPLATPELRTSPDMRIRMSTHVLVLVSDGLANSPACRLEIETARRYNKPIIAVYPHGTFGGPKGVGRRTLPGDGWRGDALERAIRGRIPGREQGFRDQRGCERARRSLGEEDEMES